MYDTDRTAKIETIIAKHRHISPLSDRILFSLREIIVQGALDPGTKVTEEMVADLFSVSRTPARAALEKLTEYGYLVYAPRVGLVVRKWMLDDFYDLYHIVQVLDGLAARCAAENGLSSSVIMRLRHLMAQLEANQATDDDHLTPEMVDHIAAHNNEFHMEIARNCGNAWLADVLGGSRMKLRMLRPYILNTYFSLEHASAHNDIIEAIIARDAKKAEAAAIDHVQWSIGRLQMAQHYADIEVPL